MGEYVPSPGTKMSDLPGMGGIYNTINFHSFAYAGNNPVKLIDPDGNYLESGWDIFSLMLGVYSLGYNLSQGQYAHAAVDALGIVADLVAVATPVPGGAGAAIKATRGSQIAKNLKTASFVADAAVSSYDAAKKLEAGDTAGAALDAGGALLSITSAGLIDNAGDSLLKNASEQYTQAAIRPRTDANRVILNRAANNAVVGGNTLKATNAAVQTTRVVTGQIRGNGQQTTPSPRPQIHQIGPGGFSGPPPNTQQTVQDTYTGPGSTTYLRTPW
jgi:hypothetical protein